jgi:hypothetical protein
VTRVNVVDFDRDDDPLTVASPPVPGIVSVLYLPVPRWVAPSEVDRRSNRLDEQWRVFPDLVVCRVHPAQLREFLAAPAIVEDLVARFPGVPVVLLSWDGAFRWRALSGELDPASIADPLGAALAHAELRSVLDRSGVILPPTDGYHYSGPNGMHYESFVRVGTAIQEVDSLDAIAFWLLPRLSRSPVVVLESWTIISLGLNAGQYLRDNAIRGPDGEPAQVVAVETRRSYAEPRERLLQRLAGVRKRHGAPDPPPVLALVSVSSTGDTAEDLLRTCQRAGFDDIDVVGLYRAEEPDRPESLCVLPEVSRHWPPGPDTCPHCEKRSQIVTVLPDSYLLDLAATVRDDIAIRITDAQFARRFFGRYAGCGAISVHRDQHDRRRHHMVYVDVLPLLGHPDFLGGLERELGEVDEVDLILCPEHDAARALAAVVSDHVGLPVLEADPQRLLELQPEEAELLRAARRVLVVDDVVITGTRLRHYRNMLHREGVAIHDDFELHVLAGVARPSDLARLKGVMDFTHDDERFHFVELLPLPNWGERDCPWCDELTTLGRFGSYAPTSTVLAARFRALREVRDGLAEGLYLPWLADEQGITDPMLLGPNSIFRAKTEPELFAAVASSLQALRNDDELNERFTLPVAKVLSRNFAFEGRFYDTVITACLLRATRRHDIRAALVDPALEEMVGDRLAEAAVVALHGEILFALYRRQLPGGLARALATGVFEQPEADEGVRMVLRAALEADRAG